MKLVKVPLPTRRDDHWGDWDGRCGELKKRLGSDGKRRAGTTVQPMFNPFEEGSWSTACGDYGDLVLAMSVVSKDRCESGQRGPSFTARVVAVLWFALAAASTPACRATRVSAPDAITAQPAVGTLPASATPTSGTPVAPADALDGPAAAPATSDGLTTVLRAFPNGEVSQVHRTGLLGEYLGRLLDEIAFEGDTSRLDGDQSKADIAFVVDRSMPENGVYELVLALAENRAKLARGGRFALVSCGQTARAWSARIEAPFGDNPYGVLRALRGLKRTFGGTDIGASWLGLAEATRLGWRSRGARRHIVLLTDDLPPGVIFLSEEKPPPPDQAARAVVQGWARATGTALHAVRYPKEPHLAPEDSQYELEKPGLRLPLLPALFRTAGYVRADSTPDLTRIVEDVLNRAAPAGEPSDVALVIDRTGLMGWALQRYFNVRPILDGFVATPGHRLALVQWGQGKAAVVTDFTSRRGAVPRAIAALRLDTSGEWPKPLFGALAVAQNLSWLPGARKVVVLLTGGTSYDFSYEVLNWVDDAGVALTFVEIGEGFSRVANRRR